MQLNRIYVIYRAIHLTNVDHNNDYNDNFCKWNGSLWSIIHVKTDFIKWRIEFMQK